MSNGTNDSQAKLAALEATFAAKLPDKIREIEDAVGDSLEAVRGLAHKLVGSAGTFGFSNLGYTAQKLELFCQSLTEKNKKPSDDDFKQINEWISMLCECAKIAPSHKRTK